MDSQSNTDLTFISSEDMLEELKKRFDAIIIIGIQQKTGKEEDTYYHNYSGGIANCIGLCDLMKDILKNNYLANK